MKLKFSQLIAYSKKNIFLKKSCRKLLPDIFLKNQNLISGSKVKFYTTCFYCVVSLGLLKYIETKLQTTCFYLILNFLKKQKKV